MKIQDTVLALLYISGHVASDIAFKRIKTSHVNCVCIFLHIKDTKYY